MGFESSAAKETKRRTKVTKSHRQNYVLNFSAGLRFFVLKIVQIFWKASLFAFFKTMIRPEMICLKRCSWWNVFFSGQYLPSVKFVCCPVSVVPEDLDIVEHHFDDFLSLVQFMLDLVAVGLSILKKIWVYRTEKPLAHYENAKSMPNKLLFCWYAQFMTN